MKVSVVSEVLNFTSQVSEHPSLPTGSNAILLLPTLRERGRLVSVRAVVILLPTFFFIFTTLIGENTIELCIKV